MNSPTDKRKMHFQDPMRFSTRVGVVGGDFSTAKSFCGVPEIKTTISIRDVNCLNCIRRVEYLLGVARKRIEDAQKPVVEPELFEEKEDAIETYRCGG